MTDDILELRPHINGQVAKPLRVELGDPLTAEEIAGIAGNEDHPKSTPAVEQLRDSHHRLARCLASGMNQAQASLQTGYSNGRISMLCADPSFKDLIEVYRKENNEEYVTFQSLATANMVRAERIIADSLEAVAERETPLSPAELRPIFEVASGRMDRFGYPAHTVGHNVNHDLAGRLKTARQRSGLDPKGPLVIDALKEEPVPDES